MKLSEEREWLFAGRADVQDYIRWNGLSAIDGSSTLKGEKSIAAMVQLGANTRV